MRQDATLKISIINYKSAIIPHKAFQFHIKLVSLARFWKLMQEYVYEKISYVTNYDKFRGQIITETIVNENGI
jgi:hypothetical protein